MPAEDEIDEPADTTPGERRFRGLTPRRLMIMLCAASFAPAIAAALGSGIPGAEITAITGIVGSISGGAVSIGLMDAAQKLRHAGNLTEDDVADQVTDSLDLALPADDGPGSADLEIAGALQRVNGAETITKMLRAQGDVSALAELTAALTSLDASFPLALDVLRDGFAQVIQNQVQQDYFSREILVRLARIQRDLDESSIRDIAAAPRAVVVPTRSGCPYLGLKSFSELDSAVFYGREDLTAKLTDQLTDGTREGILIVTGVSGVGKTSLLHAGLLHTLEHGVRVPGSERWPRYSLIPAADPLPRFAQILAAVGSDDQEQIMRRLAAAPESAHYVVRQQLDRYAHTLGRTTGSARLVLVIDQFENFFDLDLSEGQRVEYLAVLQAAASYPTEPGGLPPAAIAVAIRADRYDRCIETPVLRQSVEARTFVVDSMDDDGLRRAITRPAADAGLSIEPGLVDDVLSDVDTVPRDGVLPLLSEAMLLTWINSEGNWLTRNGYQEGGGVRGAVKDSADMVYASLDSRQQELARDILIEMTAIRHDRHVRRATTLTRIRAAHPGEEAAVETVLDALRAARLIVIGSTVQIVHDILLEVWPRLKGWISEDSRNFVGHRQFQDDVELWSAQREQREYLYQRIRLADLTRNMATWPKGRYPLTPVDGRFLTASKRAVARRIAQRRLMTGALAALIVVSIAAAVVASFATANADRQRQVALAGQLAALSQEQDTGNPVVAALLAAAAWQEDNQSPQATQSMLQILAQPVRAVYTETGGSAITAVAFSPRRHVLATAGKTIIFWDTTTNRPIGPPITVPGGAAALAFNSAGTMVATGDKDGTARLWNVSTGREIGSPMTASSGGPVNAVAFSPGGSLLATADGDGTARLWNVGTGREFGHALVDGGQAGEPMTDVTFSPDGTRLATASRDGTARLWDVATQREIGHAMTDRVANTSATQSLTTQMVSAVFSPNGEVLATADREGTVSLWHVATQRLDGRQMTAADGSNDLAFSPDGRTLAVGDVASAVELWDIPTRTLVTPLYWAYPDGAISGVVFSPDATSMATVSTNGTARLWDLTSFHIATPQVDIGYGKAISLDARTIVGVDLDGAVRLWNMDTGRAGLTIPDGETGGVDAAALSPDGQILATGGDSGIVQLWNAHTGQPIGKPITVSASAGVSALAFSPDGHTLASGDENGIVRLRSVATGKAGRRMPGRSVAVTSLTFSPDGKLLAATDSHGKLRLWDTATDLLTGNHITATADAVAFSPDGQTLATADLDGTARLWDLGRDQEIGVPMVGTYEGPVQAIAFSSDGSLLATGGSDGDASLWDVKTQGAIGAVLDVDNSLNGVPLVGFTPDDSRLTTLDGDGYAVQWNIALPPAPDLHSAVCLLAGRSLTPQEWTGYVSSAPYVDGCP